MTSSTTGNYEAYFVANIPPLPDLALAGGLYSDSPVDPTTINTGPDTSGDFAGANSGGDLGSSQNDTGAPAADQVGSGAKAPKPAGSTSCRQLWMSPGSYQELEIC